MPPKCDNRHRPCHSRDKDQGQKKLSSVVEKMIRFFCGVPGHYYDSICYSMVLFKQLLLLFNSIRHLLPPPLPLLLSPAVIVCHPSSTACFHHDIHRPILLLDVFVTSRSRCIILCLCLILSHCPPPAVRTTTLLPSSLLQPPVVRCSSPALSPCLHTTASVVATPSLLQPLSLRLLPPALVGHHYVGR